MTVYRVDEFEEDDELDSIDLQTEMSENSDNVKKEMFAKTTVNEEPLLLSEVVEPKPAATTRRMDKPLEIEENIVFKTKCQMMQEEVDNGKETTQKIYTDDEKSL